MRTALACLCALAAAAAAATAGAAPRDAPISTISHADQVGDAGSGPDISSLGASVSADGTLTLTLTFANRSSLGNDESAQFFLTAPSGGSLNVASFDGNRSLLSVWQDSDWQSVHYIDTTWANDTFTVTVPLSDLRDALHAPVVPSLQLSGASYVGASPGATPTLADEVPANDGYVTVVTQAQAAAPPTTTAATSPPPPPAGSPTQTSRALPYLQQKVKRLSHGRLEWTKLVLKRVPKGASATIACTRRCKLTERLHVARGTAASKRFVGVPLPGGASFLVRILERNGAGYWFRTTVTGRAAPATTSSRGCIAKGGLLVALAYC